MVWRTTGEIEIHEVTLTERQKRSSIQEREKAARLICQQRGWRYIVHTEATLPSATEEANLLALYRYRPSIYANAAVTATLQQRLKGNERQAVHILLPELAHTLSLSESTIVSALCYLRWHCVIETDLTSGLLFVNAALTPSVQVWLNEKRRHA
jgi:hypothetical protein